MATKAELIYTADGVNLEKKGREFSLSSDISERLENFPRVIDNTNSTSATDALSANMGKVLQDQINEFTGVGTFLSLWDCSTGLPETDPTTNPYKYKVGNYYIVSKVAEEGNPNYRPRGTQYNSGEASRVEETEDVKVNDWYIYDGARWIRQPNGGTEIAIDGALSPSSKNAVENRVVTNALNNKQDTINDLETIRQGAAKGNTAIQPGDNISELENNVGYQTEGDVVAKLTDYYTKDEIDEKENGYVKFGDNSPDDIFITAYDANGNGFEFYPNSFYIENEDGDVEEYEFFGDYRIAKLNETMRGFPVPKRGDDISNIVSILKRNEPVYFYEKDGEVYKIWVVQSFNGGSIRSYMNNAGDYLDVWVNENGWECDGYNVANADLVYQQSYTWHYLPNDNIWNGINFSQYRATSSSFTVTGEGLFRMGFEYKLKVKNTGHSTITVTLGNKLLNPRNIPTTIAKGKEVIFLFYSSHNTMATMELAQRIERPIGEDMSNYYNKSEVDSLLEEKANSSDLDEKADKTELNNYYTKTETDGLLNDKADKSDVNTKTFYLSTDEDLEPVQAAYDWYLAGKNPIIKFQGACYVLGEGPVIGDPRGISFKFLCMDVDPTEEYNNATTHINFNNLRFFVNDDIVQSIVIDYYGVDYLDTTRDYAAPYTPRYDGSPATKKYVDDAIAGVSGIQNDTTGTTSSITKIWVGTEAEYNALTTKDATTLYHIKE